MRRFGILKTGLLGGVCLLALATTAIAGGEKPFNVPAGDLKSALDSYTRQAGVQLIYREDDVRGVKSRGVTGEQSTDDALSRVLEGTGLKAARDPSGALSIERAATTVRPRQAAQADLIPTAHPMPGGRLEEIIVTAQKREERLIDVPQSVSVLSGEALARLSATQFRDFANTVPGLSFSTLGAGYNQIALRGVTVGADIGATVGIYVDEVPYGTSGPFTDGPNNTLDVGLFDLNRIEVLRGPQGTLYGASTMGGIIKYVTTRPDLSDTSLIANAGLSGTRHGDANYNAAVSVNVPINDRVAARVGTYYSRDGGYIDNLGNGEDNVNNSKVYGGRFDLLFAPSERFDVRLTGFLQNIDRDGEATVDYTFAGVPSFGDLTQNRRIAERYEQKFRLASATINYDFGPARFVSITSYQTVRMFNISDVSPFYVPALSFAGPFGAIAVRYTPETDKFTQEVRLSGEVGETLEWQLGGFYTDEESTYGQNFILLAPNFREIPNTLYSYLAPTSYSEEAAFGNLSWHVTDKLTLSGGLRYAHNTQSFEQIGGGLLGQSTPKRVSGDGVVTYLANAQYKFQDNLTAYARYATGYRPGGPNFNVLDPTTGRPIGPTSFRPDSLDSYEVGLKGESADGVFGGDVSLYRINWNDIQIITSSAGFAGRSNAPDGAQIEGVELALQARPVPDLLLTGAFAYQNAQLNAANPDLGAAKGERLPNVPKFTAAVGADYIFREYAVLPRIGATVRFVSDRPASFNAAGLYRQYQLPDYTSVDLRTGITLDEVDLQAYVRNLFDVRGQLSAGNWRGVAQPAIMQPRTIGINASIAY